MMMLGRTAMENTSRTRGSYQQELCANGVYPVAVYYCIVEHGLVFGYMVWLCKRVVIIFRGICIVRVAQRANPMVI